MNNKQTLVMLGLGLAGMIAGPAGAAEIFVNSNITTSQTWTANNTYNLQSQIYVTNGATLTIEPGTVIASTPSANGSGSLAITRGSKIIAAGTKDEPIIFTSTADDFVTYRQAANEWGNVTLMGNAYVSNGVGSPNFVAGNVSSCGNNVARMEGLTESDAFVLYGGTDDDDDSGTLRYVSIRYGGRVVGLTNELNGLSLGGVGRETDIDHIEIMNNVDDGIEVWGGTVNLKYVSIWNVGDDSLDIDQGWRGQAQFGLIVQGYSIDAPQGSGVGDNCIEHDGAENADAQPVTTGQIRNFTVIGQPAQGAGDHGTAWRDGCRMQYAKMIFMDLGDHLVQNDGDDGDGNNGYGFGGTLPFLDAGGADIWDTDATQTSLINPCANPADRYQAQNPAGKLAEIKDSVFFRNLNAAYSNTDGADAVGVTIDGDNGVSNAACFNVIAPFNPGDIDDNMPVRKVTRGPVFTTVQGKFILPVVELDPLPANDALTCQSKLPAGDFFDDAPFRGGFAPGVNWLCDWTAAWNYGLVTPPAEGCPVAAPPCPADCVPPGGNGQVNIDDLLAVVSSFGDPGGPCDIAPDNGDGTFGNGTINIDDLLKVISDFGPCPQ